MSFLIKGGYNTFRHHLINITLKPTGHWLTGGIYASDNQLLHKIDSSGFNVIECDKYGSVYVLLLNKRVLFVSKQKFTYDVSLNFSGENNFSQTNMYSFIDYSLVDSI